MFKPYQNDLFSPNKLTNNNKPFIINHNINISVQTNKRSFMHLQTKFLLVATICYSGIIATINPQNNIPLLATGTLSEQIVQIEAEYTSICDEINPLTQKTRLLNLKHITEKTIELHSSSSDNYLRAIRTVSLSLLSMILMAQAVNFDYSSYDYPVAASVYRCKFKYSLTGSLATGALATISYLKNDKHYDECLRLAKILITIDDALAHLDNQTGN